MQTLEESLAGMFEQQLQSAKISDNVVDNAYAEYAIACYRSRTKFVRTRLAFSININMFKGI